MTCCCHFSVIDIIKNVFYSKTVQLASGTKYFFEHFPAVSKKKKVIKIRKKITACPMELYSTPQTEGKKYLKERKKTHSDQ